MSAEECELVWRADKTDFFQALSRRSGHRGLTRLKFATDEHELRRVLLSHGEEPAAIHEADPGDGQDHDRCSSIR